MSFKPQFFHCTHCGQVVSVLKDKGVSIHCCGEPMKKLVPNTVDAAQEKHVPVALRDGDKLTVSVGAVPHPMTDEHFIEWIYLSQENGGQRRLLKPGAPAEAVFCLNGSEPLEVYAYCNLHGLWKTAL